MKRKVVKLSSVRLSPNEEALLIKEEHERRRRLRIKQVREQERSIAVQIREEVKHRRKQQLEQLANDLNAEWQMAQVEKEKSLEKLYLCSLWEVGQGHRQAKENEPDLKAQSQQVSVNREKAEKRHREALRELKQQRDKETEVQNRYIKTRKKVLLIEKKRAVRIANLPPPLPNPLAELEVRKYPAVKMYDVDSFSVTHYHMSEPYVDREINSNQISARLTAEEEAKRLEELQQEAEMERREQFEKARLRGSHALQMVHLIQDREKLVKELEQMQQADLTLRRQAVAQMPPQLFEPPFRRMEVKEDRQREMEFAFEDIYAGDKKIRGDLVLRLEPEPLPAPSVGTQDEDLNLSVEPEGVQKEEQYDKDSQEELAILCLGKTVVPRLMASTETSESPSKAALKKLFTKIRMQKDHCTSKSESKSVTQGMTIESGSITSEENEPRILTKSTANNDVNKKHLEMQSMKAHANEQQKEVSEVTIMAGSTTLCHPKEQAIRIRSEVDRRKQLHELEQQKQQQLTLIWQSEQQKRNLEAHLEKAQLLQQQADENHGRLSSDFEKQSQQEHGPIKDCLGHQKERKDNTVNEQSTWRPRAAHMDIGHLGVNPESEHCKLVSDELFPADEHIRKIHQYQQHLIEQNRLHKKSVEEIRKQLEEYELKKGWSSVSTITRHLSEQHLISPISHYDKCAGSELQSEHLLLQKSNSGSENVEQLNPLSSVLRTLKDFSTGSTKENLQLKNEDQLKNLQPAIQINGALNPSRCCDSKSIQDGSHSSESLSIEVLTKEAQHWPSKPPVSKARFGLFGLIEQHELSAIQEVESPKSDRLSMFVNRNAFSDNCCSSEASELMSSRMDSSCSSEIDLTGISTNSSSQHSSSVANSTAESIQTGRMTWREKLKLETGSFPGQVSSAPISRLQRYSADVDRGKFEDPGRPSVTCSTTSKVLFPYSWSSNAFGFNAQTSPEADQISSTTLSTGSLPSNEHIDVGPMSSGDYPSVIHDVTSEQLTATSSVCTPSSLSSFPANLDTVDMIYCSPKLEEYIPTGSRIQQVIEKYTRNLNQLLDSSERYQDSTTDHTVSDQGVTNFSLQLQSSQQNTDGEFQPLESRPDFSISDSSLSPTSSKNSYVLDTNGTTIDQHSNLATSSKIKPFTDSIASTVDHGRTACSIDQKEEYIQQGYNVDNGLKPFQGLQLEMIPGLDMDHSGGSSTYDRISEQQFNNEASSINSEYRPTTRIIKPGTVTAASQTLEPADRLTCSDLATDNLRGGDRETSEYFGSFSQLNATLSSINDDNDNISDQNGKQLEDCECKTPQVITFTKINSNEANEVATLNDLPIEPFKLMLLEEQYCTGSEVNHVSEQNHMLNSEQLHPARAETVAILENEFECEAEQDLPRSSNLASKVCTIQNIMPVWEIESDVGIMEEPELTQLTLNDSSLVDDELGQEFPIENLTSKNELNEFQAFSQASGLQPKLDTTDHTISTLHTLTVANHKLNYKESSPQKFPTVMIFEFGSPKVRIEAVLKKKHKFLANSAKRLEDMKRKERSGVVQSVEHCKKPIPLKQEQTLFASSSLAAQLKMVGEVRVSTPEDRRDVEIEMRQRTLRLYSQLDEVKNRKKKVTSQIVCARNREKVKEFQKKTLEKLRAKKNGPVMLHDR
ncbi:uncharacterized protein cep295 isoform X7 [Scyliorhinus torazame]|uniref:uncharacterized protein cep295 isoform X7 n=1 Tax=Scyliorhinus torazame TaxID=75743 RepID=UPI003B5CB965